MKIEIIDLGINNISSIAKAIEYAAPDSSTCRILEHARESNNADMYILPGLGHFMTGMSRLKETGMDELLVSGFAQSKKIIGVCLGLQLLCDSSEESPDVRGLGIIKGNVKKLSTDFTVPNIGWDEVISEKDVGPFQSLDSGKDFYFVHSYHAVLDNKSDLLTSTPFGDRYFTSSLLKDTVLAFQFHPEKSGKIGVQLFNEVFRWVAD